MSLRGHSVTQRTTELRIHIFWAVMPCHWLSGSTHSEGTHPATRSHISEDLNHMRQHCVNLTHHNKLWDAVSPLTLRFQKWFPKIKINLISHNKKKLSGLGLHIKSISQMYYFNKNHSHFIIFWLIRNTVNTVTEVYAAWLGYHGLITDSSNARDSSLPQFLHQLCTYLTTCPLGQNGWRTKLTIHLYLMLRL
jgi:hypothetical protein